MGKLLNRKGFLISFTMILILVSSIFSQFVLASDQLPERNAYHYVDGEGLLSDETKSIIESVNQDLINNEEGEIVVVTTDSFEPFADAKEYALRFFEKWEIGSKEQDNGLLIVVSSKERKSRIEVGYGLEGILPDGKTGRFQDDYAIPHFKNDDYDTGIRNLFLNFAYEISPTVKETYKDKEVITKESSTSTSSDDGSSDSTLAEALLTLIGLLALVLGIISIGLPILIIRFLYLIMRIPIYRMNDKKTGKNSLLGYQYSFKSGSTIDRIISKFISMNEERSKYYSNNKMGKRAIRGKRSFWSPIVLAIANFRKLGDSNSSGSSSYDDSSYRDRSYSGGSSGSGRSGGGRSGGGGSDRSW